jgi:hypothetical protein
MKGKPPSPEPGFPLARKYGWALYLGAGAAFQFVAGVFIALEFDWGWIPMLGMFGIGFALIAHARRMLELRPREEPGPFL